MKKLLLLFATLLTIGSWSQTPFWIQTTYKGAFPITDGTTQTDWTSGWSNFDPENTVYPQTTTTLNADITTNTTISGVVLLENKVYVRNGATITILPGTIIRGDASTQASLIITRGSKIIAVGTETNPIVFTSNEDIGNRAEGDWGGLVILGQAINNQPSGVANIEGIPPTSNTQHGGQNDDDNSGQLKWVRVEFAGIALEPNKEINGITFGSVGRLTEVDYVQVSFSGDDSFEWFGGTVNCKHLIAFRGLDDDFDTDFGFRGNVQFALSIKDSNLSDAAGDSNAFESDNDGTGSSALPQTQAVFSNFTIIGPKMTGTLPVGEKFEKAFRIRRNSSISIFNSIIVGWEKGLSIEGSAVESNYNSGNLQFQNNILDCDVNYTTATSNFYNTIATQNDTTTNSSTIQFVNPYLQLGQVSDYRLQLTSVAGTGADFSSPKFVGGFLSVKSFTEFQNLKFYPNPVQEKLFVESDEIFKWTLLDSFGRVVEVGEIDGTGEIDLENLTSGLYVFTCQSKSGLTKKIIVKS